MTDREAALKILYDARPRYDGETWAQSAIDWATRQLSNRETGLRCPSCHSSFVSPAREPKYYQCQGCGLYSLEFTFKLP